MDFLNQIDLYPKVIVAMTGLLAGFVKVKGVFSSVKRKQEIKLDLEIYEQLKLNPELNIDGVKEKLENKIGQAFNSNRESLTNSLIGIITFVGFGLWSVDIFHTYDNFNGWIMLTIFCSFTGLTMLFGTPESEKSKDVFFKIGFFDKTNFLFGLTVTLVTSFVTPILYFKLNGLTFWFFLSCLVWLIGLVSLIKNTRTIK